MDEIDFQVYIQIGPVEVPGTLLDNVPRVLPQDQYPADRGPRE